jgi:trimeric autotransporter adhesin
MFLTARLFRVSGSNNVINGEYDGPLSLGGTNNSVVMVNNMQVTTSSGTLSTGSTGADPIVLTGSITASGLTLTGGVLTAQLGNGNVATLAGVSSGTEVEYIDAAGTATWSALLDSGLSNGLSVSRSNSDVTQSGAPALIAAMATCYMCDTGTGSMPVASNGTDSLHLLIAAH